MKYGNASLTLPNVQFDLWAKKTATDKEPTRVKIAKGIVAAYDPQKWLLSHVTIIASVDTDLANTQDPMSNYLIKPEYSQFVNNNGDSWERDLLKGCYKTFLGADNFVEHVQIQELSKGKVIDVALREVPIGSKDPLTGKDLTTLYADILIATNRTHEDLIRQIESGEYNATSMGCKIAYGICSQCGNKAVDDTQTCNHIKYYKGNYFFDNQGVRRRISDLCGHKTDPGSVQFIDASWVKNPAFQGAVLRNIVKLEDVNIPTGLLIDQIEKASSRNFVTPEEGDYLKAASNKFSGVLESIKAAASKGDLELMRVLEATFSKAAEDEPKAEPKAEEAPADDAAFPEVPADDNAAPPAQDPSQDPASDQPQVDPEEAAQTPLQQIKDDLKNSVLNQVKLELMQEQQNVERPIELDNSSNDNLVSRTASKIASIAKKCASQKFYEKHPKILNGLVILASTQRWSDLKKYGFSRTEALGLMHFIDKNISQNPLSENSVRALAHVKLGSDSHKFFMDYIIESGKKGNSLEYRKVANWAKILKDFNNN